MSAGSGWRKMGPLFQKAKQMVRIRADFLFAITFGLFASQNDSCIIKSFALSLFGLTSEAKSCVKAPMCQIWLDQ